jgi:pseudouridine synthase
LSTRLNKLLAERGLGARRKCDALIQEGRVRVNGEIVREPGTQVEPGRDRIEVAGRPLPVPAPLRYFALHKPVGVITTLDDPEGRRTIRDFLPPGRRLFPVGRLDADTSGLLLLTNDGELAHHLMHPRYGVEKVYRVRVDAPPTEGQLVRLSRGVEFEPGIRSSPARVRRLTVDRGGAVEIAIHEGRYRQVRRMCEAVGLNVLALHRAAYGPLRLGHLERGMWRELSEAEVSALRAASARPGSREGAPQRRGEFFSARRGVYPTGPRSERAEDGGPPKRGRRAGSREAKRIEAELGRAVRGERVRDAHRTFDRPGTRPDRERREPREPKSFERAPRPERGPKSFERSPRPEREPRAPRSFDRRGPRRESTEGTRESFARRGPRPERAPLERNGPRSFDRSGPRREGAEATRAPRSFERPGPRRDGAEKIRAPRSFDRPGTRREGAAAGRAPRSFDRRGPRREGAETGRAPRSFDRPGARREGVEKGRAPRSFDRRGPRPEAIERGRAPRSFDRKGARPVSVVKSRAPRSFDRRGPRPERVASRSFDRPRSRPAHDRPRDGSFDRGGSRPRRGGDGGGARPRSFERRPGPERSAFPRSAPSGRRGPSARPAGRRGAARPGARGADRPPRAPRSGARSSPRSGPRSGQNPRRLERGDSMERGRGPRRPRGRF